MIKASIVSIGNELLNGQTADTNARYLSGRLVELGIWVVSGYTATDDEDAIVRSVRLALGDAEVVLVTGGLGPTDDDVTRDALAKLLGRELRLKDELLEQIEEFFRGRKRPMAEKNRVQAYLPEGCEALRNHIGTAPGIMAVTEGKRIFVLPGVPSEMERMFEESVAARLRALAGEQAIFVRKLRCFGTGESNIAEVLDTLMERGRNPLVNSTAELGVITLTIFGSGANRTEAEKIVKKVEKIIRSRLGDIIFGEGEETPAEVVGRKLAEAGRTVSVAESCTGGLLGKLLTDVPGSSRYFKQGWIAYSNTAKVRELGVDAGLIESCGSVSEEVARAMAHGARKKAGSDFAIGITGIAGPEGGSEQKPVGLVYISVASARGVETERYVYAGGRDSVRRRAALTALNMLRMQLRI